MAQRFWELLSRYWSKEITTEELLELESLMLRNRDAWLKMGLIDQVSFHKIPMISEDTVDNLVVKISNQSTIKAAMPNRLKHWIVRACVALAGAGLFLAHYLYSKRDDTYKQVITEMGMKTKMRLPDGSTIWLNADSRLRYSGNFGKNNREVYLGGEAYFDIKPMAGIPFIIHTSKMDIKVLGTEFNIRSYDDESYAETALVKGTVEVILKENDHRENIILKPNQKIVWRRINNASKVTASTQSTIKVERQPLSMLTGDSSLTEETAWMSNHLVFHNETLEALSHRLERWYGMKVIIRNQELKERRFSGRADNLPAEKLLDLLQKIVPFEYTIKDNILVIQSLLSGKKYTCSGVIHTGYGLHPFLNYQLL
ncbi:MAG TPA: FecR family protein [Chitinophaga sp.]|uniref:FecR family protein n=1 Tax=Chitinophaga sp. TaxID=1869181 RepID=UPI002D04E180|nr:FecR family protein [Chitinophaga sp.]HVI45780.1 FecR family protein [Chitinophaga sp.]